MYKPTNAGPTMSNTAPIGSDRRREAYEETTVSIVNVMREFRLDQSGQSLSDTLRSTLKDKERMQLENARLRHIVRQLAQLV